MYPLHTFAIAQDIAGNDRSDAPTYALIGVDVAPTRQFHWTYYPLSSPFKHLYTVPPLGSPERYIDSRRYYFTSSMFVVGEFTDQDSRKVEVTRYEYGAAEYNTAGRGVDGFKWIIVHDVANKKKYGAWFAQDGPYRGMLARSWSEDESDTENDYFHGSPGKRYLTFERMNLKCSGPKDNVVAIRYHCDASETPSIIAYSK